MSNGSFNQADVEANKVYGILSYISILFIVGLIVSKDSEYVKFHANQGLVLFLGGIISSFCYIVPFVGGLVGGLLSLAVFILSIMGIVYAAQGEKKALPVVGDIIIIK